MSGISPERHAAVVEVQECNATEMIWPRIATDRRGWVTWDGQMAFSLYPRVSAHIRG